MQSYMRTYVCMYVLVTTSICHTSFFSLCRQHLSQATKVSEKEVIEEIASYDLWAIGIKEQELKAKYGPNVDGKIKHLLSKQVSEYLGKHKFERFLNFLLKKMNSSTVMGEKGPLITHAKASSDRVLPLSSLHNGQPQSNKTLLFLGEDEERNKIDIEGLLSWPLGAPTARETDKTRFVAWTYVCIPSPHLHVHKCHCVCMYVCTYVHTYICTYISFLHTVRMYVRMSAQFNLCNVDTLGTTKKSDYRGIVISQGCPNKSFMCAWEFGTTT